MPDFIKKRLFFGVFIQLQRPQQRQAKLARLLVQKV
jgi:hypothetical protein